MAAKKKASAAKKTSKFGGYIVLNGLSPSSNAESTGRGPFALQPQWSFARAIGPVLAPMRSGTASSRWFARLDGLRFLSMIAILVSSSSIRKRNRTFKALTWAPPFALVGMAIWFYTRSEDDLPDLRDPTSEQAVLAEMSTAYDRLPTTAPEPNANRQAIAIAPDQSWSELPRTGSAEFMLFLRFPIRIQPDQLYRNRLLNPLDKPIDAELRERMSKFLRRYLDEYRHLLDKQLALRHAAVKKRASRRQSIDYKAYFSSGRAKDYLDSLLKGREPNLDLYRAAFQQLNQGAALVTSNDQDTWVLSKEFGAVGEQYGDALRHLVRDMVGLTISWFGSIGVTPSSGVLLEDSLKYLDGNKKPMLVRLSAEKRRLRDEGQAQTGGTNK